MATIIEFPGNLSRQSQTEGELRQMLKGIGADDELVEYAAQRFRLLQSNQREISRIQLSFINSIDQAELKNIGDQIEASLKMIDERYLNLLSSLKSQLLFAEIKLFQYERERRKV